MNDDRLLARAIADAYDASSLTREPAGLLDDVLLATGHSRQRPRWFALIKEPPMRLPSGLAVGSPSARVAAFVAATILLLLLATGAVVAGATYLAATTPIIVAQDGAGDFGTISEAVTAAQDGDTIMVRPGTYSESVLIDKDITIAGDGPRDAVILEFVASSPSVRSPYGDVPYGVMLVDSRAIVRDLTVRGPNVAAAFVVVGGAPTIERVVNELEGDTAAAPHTSVGLVQGGAATIRDSRLEGPIWELGRPTIPGYEDVRGSGQVVVMNNQMDFAGIWVTVTDGSIIADNVTDLIEVELVGAGAAEVSGNDATGVALLADGSGVVVRDNVVLGGSGGRGIQIDGGSPLVERNQVGGTEVGIAVMAASSPTIRSNAIEDNAVGIGVLGSDASPVIEGNRFCSNGMDLVVPEGSTLTLDSSNEICPGSASIR